MPGPKATPASWNRLADWTAWNETDRYDWILGSDILYGESLHAQVGRIFETNLAPGGRILISDPFRSMSLRFLEKLEGERWRVSFSKWDVGEEQAVGVFELVPPG